MSSGGIVGLVVNAVNWTVADVMSKDPVRVELAASFKSCLNLMRMHDLSALPVVADDRVVGIVSEADLLAKEAPDPARRRREHAVRKGGALTAVDLMSSDPVTTTPAAPLATAASLMFEHRLKVLPVVDSETRLVGIVTTAHLLKVFLRSDESLRREIVRGLIEIPLSGEIEVGVRNGVVNLRGDVATRFLADLLTRLVEGTPGVVGVDSRLAVAGESVAIGSKREDVDC
jgi:CBS-domain-containing membrane protein